MASSSVRGKLGSSFGSGGGAAPAGGGNNVVQLPTNNPGRELVNAIARTDASLARAQATADRITRRRRRNGDTNVIPFASRN